MLQNPLGGFTSSVSDSADQDEIICSSNKFLGDANVAGPVTLC